MTKYNKNNELLHQNAYTNKKINIQLKDILSKNMDAYFQIIVEFSDNKRIISEKICFVNLDVTIDEYIERTLKNRIVEGWKKTQVLGYKALYIEAEKKENYKSMFEALDNIKKTIDLNSDAVGEDMYKKSGIHRFFIHSDIDDQPVLIQLIIPKDYDDKKEYPVIFYTSPTSGDTKYQRLSIKGLTEDFIIADITGHNVVGGSYIGEASMMELINWVTNNFSVDYQKFYFVGQSDGGYATWAIAQNHPYLPAAIFPQISTPYLETMSNTANIPIFQTYSKTDFTFNNWNKRQSNQVNIFENYHQIHNKNYRSSSPDL